MPSITIDCKERMAERYDASYWERFSLCIELKLRDLPCYEEIDEVAVRFQLAGVRE